MLPRLIRADRLEVQEEPNTALLNLFRIASPMMTDYEIAKRNENWCVPPDCFYAWLMLAGACWLGYVWVVLMFS